MTNTPSTHSASKVGADLEAQATISPRDQPALPYVPRNFANPAPLGLLAFATSIFLISLFNAAPGGTKTPNVIVGDMIMFGGVAQFIAGIMEFIAGNTFGATVFTSYAAFNVAYALIYVPGTGILAAYIDPKTGVPNEQLPQALGYFIIAWLIVSLIFTVAATRSSWILLILLIFVDITLVFLAAANMADVPQLEKAAAATGIISAALAYYAGAAGLWGNGLTAFTLPVGDLRKRE